MIKNIVEKTCAFLHGLDLICFSHLRWGFVYQRPQHLLSRFTKHTRVFFIEEPLMHGEPDRLQITRDSENLFIVIPYLQNNDNKSISFRLQRLVDSLLSEMQINKYFLWYYTPMALPFSQHLNPEFVVYDCMDELSAFKFAPPEIKFKEQMLFKRADVVFTGGYSIYESKKNQHNNIHPFPSSIDKHHFEQARFIVDQPFDQKTIPYPRFGYCGVIDERMDIDLIANVADQKPDWHFVMIGPVVKINPDTLPRLSNIHYLGGKGYKELPNYIAGWDIALIPFALNESTRFISPTKTPEYLAAGKPVISTPIKDVIRPYGELGVVHIASSPEEFISHAEHELKKKRRNDWLKKVDNFLEGNSWDRTWSQMVRHLENLITLNRVNNVEEKLYV